MRNGLQVSFRRDRLLQALHTGFEPGGGDGLLCLENSEIHLFIPRAVDSGIEDCPWGRFFFEAGLPEDSACHVYAFADNEDGKSAAGREAYLLNEAVDAADKKRLFLKEGAIRYTNRTDMLLYRLKGRRLYLMLEIAGRGKGWIKDLKIQVPGDNFMRTFPEVYQAHNSFFHRYLSVFSSVYNEFEEKLDHMERLIDPDTAPSGLLDFYAGWLGLNVSRGFLREDTLRSLLKEAPALNRRKGTVWCIGRLCELLVGEKPIIVEKSHMADYTGNGDSAVYDRLFGDSLCDVTLLFLRKQKEQEKASLLYLLRQFTPARCRIRPVYMEKGDFMDGHCYLNINACLHTCHKGRLDRGLTLSGQAVIRGEEEE